MTAAKTEVEDSNRRGTASADAAERLRMADLVEATGVPKSTILYYVAEGLLPEPVRPKPNVAYYDPPNLTWPFAVYIATVEVDPETGVWDVLRLVAVDDCGVRINPMIVEGQIMGGLTEAYAMANMQFITFDEEGNCIGSNFTDYLLPTAWETPGFELHEVVTPCPHHPIGAKGIGECAAVGGPAAFVNAVMDAVKDTGARNIDMPVLPDRVYEALQTGQDVSGAPPVKRDA